MAALDDFQAAYNNYAAILKKLTQDNLGNASPKLDYSVDGKSVSWTQYQSFIIDKMRELRQIIQMESDPFQLSSRVVT